MASTVTYTAANSVPINISWKCSKCGTINDVNSTITISKQKTTTIRNSAGAEQENSAALQAQWKNAALEIIKNPAKDPNAFRRSVNIKYCRCKNCNKREVWARRQWYLSLIPITFLGTLFSVICAFATKDPIAWVIAILFVCLSIYETFEEKVYKNKVQEERSEFLPQIKTDNIELISYAGEDGYDISYSTYDEYSPSNISRQVTVPSREDQPVYPSNTRAIKYCSYCGKELKENSQFCSFCGADLRKLK